MGRSNIEYLEWDITCVEGCTPISAGCANCYAQDYLRRFKKPMSVTLHPDRLERDMAKLTRIREPQVVGIAFTGDLFHEDVPFEFIDRVGNAIGHIPQHIYLFLTKRADRMLEYFDQHCVGELPGNIWPMVSVEDQKSADNRIPFLLQIAAAHRGVSIEPMLGPVELNRIEQMVGGGARFCTSALHGFQQSPEERRVIPSWAGRSLDWVVVGCESGKNRRPFDEDWVRTIRDQCCSRVPFMYKQGRQNGRVVKLPLLDGVRHTDGPGKLC